MECPICYEKVTSENDCTVTKCGHVFHSTCLIRNIVISGSNCPYCRCCLETGNFKEVKENNDIDSLPEIITDSDSDNDSENDDYMLEPSTSTAYNVLIYNIDNIIDNMRKIENIIY